MKECPRNESFVDGNVGGRSETDSERRMFASEREHVLFECTLYGEERGRWRGAVRDLREMVWRNMK